MQKLNIDAEAKRIFEPIEFTIDNKDYVVEKIESESLETLIGAGENHKQMRVALAEMVGAPAGEFKKTDTRKLTLAVKHITDSTTRAFEGLDSKNSLGGNAAKSQ